MREYPVFVPLGEDRLASVITVPDGDPRGIVLLLTGGSAARGHRFGVWTRAAARLADEHGLASVRMDYRGTGDSSGELRQWRMSEMPVDQALAVLRFGMRATGVDRAAVTGNCMGARLALAVAAEVPECVGGLCIRTPVLGPSAVGKAVEKMNRTQIGDLLRSHQAVRTLARRVTGRKKKSSAGVRGPVSSALSRGHLLFLYSEDDFTFNRQVLAELEGLVSRLPQDQRARYELRVLSGGNLKGFESLEVQQRVIDVVVDWMGERFDAADPGRERAAEPGQRR